MIPEYACGGAMATVRMSLVWCRWGGGAQPGKTHVFTIGPISWVLVSLQCVTDDFGNLVQVSA